MIALERIHTPGLGPIYPSTLHTGAPVLAWIWGGEKAGGSWKSPLSLPIDGLRWLFDIHDMSSRFGEREREGKRVIEKFPGDQAFFSPSPLSCPIGKVRKAQFSPCENILDPLCKEWVNFNTESASHNASENSVTAYINIRENPQQTQPTKLL